MLTSALLCSIAPRPLVIPESSDIVIHLPPEARSNSARVSFDGKGGLRMRKVQWLTSFTTKCCACVSVRVYVCVSCADPWSTNRPENDLLGVCSMLLYRKGGK
jgi:hypothetical protein